MNKSTVRFDGHTLIINNKPVILIGGEFHYFRTPHTLWEDRISKMQRSGCNLLSTYIPWNFHEEKEGILNWEGDRDLPRFLELCRKYKMYVIIKPGPYICAEWDFGGFPHWLLEKDVPLRVPDERYLNIVNTWFKEVARVIKPHLITNNGNIVLIQVENEYDHLIEESGIVDCKETAKKYLLTLLRFAREQGIDIPAFTNEGSCILGTEIINTHTYYPNIPWIWMWEFNDFDRKIEEGRKVQADKPLMILELEAGWFAQYGKPLYEVETGLTEAITKTILTYGASVINYYMFGGGTSFPYWPAKGDFGGTGICTTFDFGISPIREWGEIHDKFHYIKNHAYFLQSFPELITEGVTTYEDVSVLQGGEDITRVSLHAQGKDGSFKNSFENVKVIQRKSSMGSVILVRNLEPEKKRIQLKYRSGLADQELLIPSEPADIGPYSSFLWPADFHLSPGLKIIYSTSELISRKKIGKQEFIIMRNNKGFRGSRGELVLCTDARIKVLNGSLRAGPTQDRFQKIQYPNRRTTVFSADDHIFILLPELEANRLWLNDDSIILSRSYFLKKSSETETGLFLDLQVKPDKNKQKLLLWQGKKARTVLVDGKKVPFTIRKDGSLEINYLFHEKRRNEVKWESEWKYHPDTDEKGKRLDDNSWLTISKDSPLEKARFFRHGYYWYRSCFSLEPGFDTIKLKANSNEMDRFTVYVNGQFRWIGIGSPELDITSLVHAGGNILAVCYENAYHTKAHPHEGPIKKMSGMYYPVKVISKTGTAVKEYEIPEWKVQDGLNGVNQGYYLPEFNDTVWLSFPASRRYVFQEDAGNIIWLRRWFNFHREKGWDLSLYLNIPRLKDRCLIYVNGFLLGKYEDIGPQHKFYIPENLLKEKNLLTLVLEGPGFHPVKQFGFLPIKFDEPDFGFYYEARNMRLIVR
ncbi:MAG: beta-galactosidase [bacterium]|nr:beta-galactosidase [bacterium]